MRDIGSIEWEMTKMQSLALQDPINYDHIYSLEGLVQEFYAAIYPDSHGGFFCPLIPTIGYTHCHYLDMNKFGKNEENQYRIKCNMLTNEIEDLPEKLQPENIIQLIHSVHTLALIKNIYHDKHIASLHFSNKENMSIGGKFFINTEEKQLWYGIDNNESSAEIVISNWSGKENLQVDLDLLLLYLNTRNNQALLELIRHRVLLPDFIKWVAKNPTYITIEGTQEHLANERSNIHFTNGILGIHEEYGESRERCVTRYQSYIDTYIKQNDFFDQVFFIGNGMFDNDIAFAHYNHDLYKILNMRYGYKCRFYVPNPHGPCDQPITSPDDIIGQLRDYLMYNPDKKVLFTLGLHGQPDGSASYIGGAFLKYHFEELFELAAEYKSLQIIIMSCWSGTKTDALQGNIIMSSSQQVSYSAYTKLFVEALYTGKTIYEAHMYTMLHYHESLLPTSFYDDDGYSKEICPLLYDSGSLAFHKDH